MTKSVNLFVPGRLCLFGEHSDWAGMYRTINSDIDKGTAIVCGIEQGIYANAEKADKFIMTCSSEMKVDEYWECEMISQRLLDVARQGVFFSYVAGVAAYIIDNFNVGGVKITIQKRDIPLKNGFSSSAAICVLVVRAFNQLYDLNLDIKAEMEAAFRGEQLTPSRCGRLDQACAYGRKPVIMGFDGFEVDTEELHIGADFHYVLANLLASKNTIKILSDLNKAYPFANNEIELKVQEALGKDNQLIVSQAKHYLETGSQKELGELMNKAQSIFDEKVAPACSELSAPILHSVIKDPNITPLIYGAKGVGSQGDGSVQFLTKGPEESTLLQRYLLEELGMPSFTLTIKKTPKVKKAIIPLAGFGTRLFPATKCISKCFMPVIDVDGCLKPALLIILDQLIESGIDDICLIISESDKVEFDHFFSKLSEEHRSKLPPTMLSIEDRIVGMQNHITYLFQKERKGFGHAVWLAKDFANSDPVLLLLGDFIYRSDIDITCSKQIIEAVHDFDRPVVSITKISLDMVHNYGILHGFWIDTNKRLMDVDQMCEKPSKNYAIENLGVKSNDDQINFYATFGQYILTKDVFDELEKEILGADLNSSNSEFGLTPALEAVRMKKGMYAFEPEGKSFDIGIPEAFYSTMCEFSKYGING